jgi:predicted transcriptional regulator
MRILADLPDDDIDWLDRRARETGMSRAALLREAVAAFRAEKQSDAIERYFGLWAAHGFAEDGVEHQHRVRTEWDSGAR